MTRHTLYLTTEACRSIEDKDLALYLTFAGSKGGNLASIMLTRDQAIALHNGLVSVLLKMTEGN
jgi:hypothetical protein